MTDEQSFLRGLLMSPEDLSIRSVYADWLEDRGDPRAEFVRLDNGLDRLNFVDWLEKGGSLPWYVERYPEVRRLAEEWQSTKQLLNQLEGLSADIDQDWLAFMNTLACPFRPFFFFNNHGNPSECQPDELPFAEPIGTRGAVITTESAFRDEDSLKPGLMQDLRFLTELKLDECNYGAATCPVHPFICELRKNRSKLTGKDVLISLKVTNFQSRHIPSLDVTRIPYPGYNPGNGTGTDNDEIHNDFDGQYIFAKRNEDLGVESDVEIDEYSGTHGQLRRYVANEQLWYVLLHTTPEQVEEFQFSRYAILLAVGESPSGNRLLGVITHQVCHNLCD